MQDEVSEMCSRLLRSYVLPHTQTDRLTAADDEVLKPYFYMAVGVLLWCTLCSTRLLPHLLHQDENSSHVTAITCDRVAGDSAYRYQCSLAVHRLRVNLSVKRFVLDTTGVVWTQPTDTESMEVWLDTVFSSSSCCRYLEFTHTGQDKTICVCVCVKVKSPCSPSHVVVCKVMITNNDLIIKIN